MTSKAQRIANSAVKAAGGKRIVGGKNRFSAVKAVKKEKKKTQGNKTVN